MSDVEQRLRSALNARAELVHPEDLSLSPVLDPPETEPGPWWQKPGSYLFLAAVAVIVIALPLLALANSATDDGDRDTGDIANSPPSTTMTDPVPMEVDRGKGDVDGDGTADRIRVVRTDARRRSSIEVVLSSTRTTVAVVPRQAGDIDLVESADIDGRRGSEILAVVAGRSDDPHRSRPTVISLRDGELTEILAVDLGAGYWWIRDGELWWWAGRHTGATEVGPLDVTRFPHADQLRPADAGQWCVVPAEPRQLLDCSEGGRPGNPDDPTGEPVSDPWWEGPVDGLPGTWNVEGSYRGGVPTDLDGDGEVDDVSLAGSDLVVRTGAEESRLPVDGPNPSIEGVVRLSGLTTPVVLVHTTDGAAGTTYVDWRAFAFVDGDLVRLGTVPLAPTFASQYSNLTPDEGGHPVVRTWLVGDDALYGMDFLERALVAGPEGAEVWAYQVRVRSWYVDGRTIRATTVGQGCVAPEIGMQISECPDGL